MKLRTAVAPVFTADLLPIYSNRDLEDSERSLHPRKLRLLDEFGDRPDVL